MNYKGKNKLLMQRLLVKSKEQAAGMHWKPQQEISPSSSWALSALKEYNLGRQVEGDRAFHSVAFFCARVTCVTTERTKKL